jgi:hypothetical protein
MMAKSVASPVTLSCSDWTSRPEVIFEEMCRAFAQMGVNWQMLCCVDTLCRLP